jgi:hypothetical protein
MATLSDNRLDLPIGGMYEPDFEAVIGSVITVAWHPTRNTRPPAVSDPIWHTARRRGSDRYVLGFRAHPQSPC